MGAIQYVEHFFGAVYDFVKGEYLKHFNRDNLDSLLTISHAEDFLGMFGSIDSCKQHWEACSVAWHKQFEGKVETLTTMSYYVGTVHSDGNTQTGMRANLVHLERLMKRSEIYGTKRSTGRGRLTHGASCPDQK